ncbi:unnamed protein product [Calicophoron daubneyi]|uniref:Tubulin polyglutamylase ttll6 n=1 Tax=Calicophoron daubneyi TaxID=300641 RepID=A0AAV2T1E1_CALDB
MDDSAQQVTSLKQERPNNSSPGDVIDSYLSSSDDDPVDGEEFIKDIAAFGPALGLIDAEGLFVLPPEDYGEAFDDDNSTSNVVSESPTRETLSLPSPPTFGSEIIPLARRKRRKKKRVFTVNLTNCRYESVRRVLRRYGFREVEEDEDWNLYWTDFSVSLDRVVVMKTWQKINHFPGMSEICRKDSLARNFNRMSKAFPKEYNFFPKTWCLPSEWSELQNYARRRKSRTYILKPDTGCQGKGIFITRSAKDIRPMENMICQVYLTKPFLIDGYKFDMRVYVLITSCDPLRVYVFKDGLVRFTTIQYAEPNQRNIHNMYMHLTNYAVQKHSQGFIRDDEEGGTKRRITTLNRWFKDNGYDTEKIWNDVDDVVIKTVLCGYGVLRHNYRTCFPNHIASSACFEILGFDIMFNNKLKPYVLEVNHSPSFNTDSKLDKEIKESMIWDTIQLAHFGNLSKKKCIEDERKRIRNRLLQKAARKDVKDALEKEMARHQEQNEHYENTHMGNFRLIFPGERKEKYAQLLNPQATFYQETTTYKVRSECSRLQRAELRQKQEKLDLILSRSKLSAPESPGPGKIVLKPNIRRSASGVSERPGQLPAPPPPPPPAPVPPPPELVPPPPPPPIVEKPLPLQRAKTSLEKEHGPEGPEGEKRPSSSPGLTSDPKHVEAVEEIDEHPTWRPQSIKVEEEIERLEGLNRRERYMRNIGLIDAIHRALVNSPGVCSSMVPSKMRGANAIRGCVQDRRQDTSSSAHPIGMNSSMEQPTRGAKGDWISHRPTFIPSQALRFDSPLFEKFIRVEGTEPRTQGDCGFASSNQSCFYGNYPARQKIQPLTCIPLQYNRDVLKPPYKPLHYGTLSRPDLSDVLKNPSIVDAICDARTPGPMSNFSRALSIRGLPSLATGSSERLSAHFPRSDLVTVGSNFCHSRGGISRTLPSRSNFKNHDFKYQTQKNLADNNSSSPSDNTKNSEFDPNVLSEKRAKLLQSVGTRLASLVHSKLQMASMPPSAKSNPGRTAATSSRIKTAPRTESAMERQTVTPLSAGVFDSHRCGDVEGDQIQLCVYSKPIEIISNLRT